jgi:hypothetical protein
MNTSTEPRRRADLRDRLTAVIREAVAPEAAELLARDWASLVIADIERVHRATHPENR